MKQWQRVTNVVNVLIASCLCQYYDTYWKGVGGFGFLVKAFHGCALVSLLRIFSEKGNKLSVLLKLCR